MTNDEGIEKNDANKIKKIKQLKRKEYEVIMNDDNYIN